MQPQQPTQTQQNPIAGLSQFKSAMVKKYPNMTAAQLKSLDDHINSQASAYLAQTGALDFNTLAKSNPLQAAQLVAGGYKPPTDTASGTASGTDPKVAQKVKTTFADLNVLESYLGKSEGRGLVAGKLSNLLSGASVGASNPNTYQFNQLRQALIGPLARLVSGESGVLNDQDIRRAEGLLPRIEEPPQVAAAKLSTLKSLLSNMNGGDSSAGAPTTQGLSGGGVSGGQVQGASDQANPDQGQQPGFLQRLISGAVSPLTDTLKTIGGAGYEAVRQFDPTPRDFRNNDNPFLNNQDLQKYQTDPTGQVLNQAGRSAVLASPAVIGGVGATGLKGALLKGAIGGGAYGAAIPQEGAAIGQRALNIGAGAAEGAAISGVTYGVLQIAANAGKILHPFRTVGEMKQAAVAQAQGATVNWDQVIAKLNGEAGRVSPTDRNAFLKFVDVAKSQAQGNIPIDQAVDIASRSNVAYNAAGKVGKSASAAFNDVLGQALKEQISEVAPGVTQANKLFKMLYGAQKTAGVVKRGAATAGTYKLLGLLGL